MDCVPGIHTPMGLRMPAPTLIRSLLTSSVPLLQEVPYPIRLIWSHSLRQQADRQSSKQASIQLQFTLDRSSLLDSVKASIHRLGLDSRNDRFQTPLAMVNDSCEALDRPVSGDGGAVSVVIPLRESVNSVISELLRRRPIQEASPKL